VHATGFGSAAGVRRLNSKEAVKLFEKFAEEGEEKLDAKRADAEGLRNEILKGNADVDMRASNAPQGIIRTRSDGNCMYDAASNHLDDNIGVLEAKELALAGYRDMYDSAPLVEQERLRNLLLGELADDPDFKGETVSDALQHLSQDNVWGVSSMLLAISKTFKRRVRVYLAKRERGAGGTFMCTDWREYYQFGEEFPLDNSVDVLYIGNHYMTVSSLPPAEQIKVGISAGENI